MPPLTERLYRKDSFLTRFSGIVRDLRPMPAEQAGASARLGILLDRTAFYPTGGGQPCDTGTLAGLPVVDVREDDGGPLHIVEMRDERGRPHGAHVTIDSEVEGVVDWPRRFDHMQQHSGQHILSRAFLDIASAPTRSFHLGESICTIDIDLAKPDEELLAKSAHRANDVVFADRSVAFREIDRGEAPAGAALDPALSGLNLLDGDPIRIVDVDGFDSTPCGGTHVSRSGQIGLIGVTAWEKFKGMTRVTFLCGGRAASRLRETNGIVAACVSRLSAKAEEIPASLDRLLVEHQDLQRHTRALADRLTRLEAEELARQAGGTGRFRMAKRVFQAREKGVEEANALARRFVEPPGCLALFAVLDGDQATILAARSTQPAAPAPEGDLTMKLGDAVAQACAEAGGRGGGALNFGRGGLPATAAEAALDRIAARLGCQTMTGRS